MIHNQRKVMPIIKILTAGFIILAMQQLLQCDAQAAISLQERSALIDLYNSTNGPNWTSHSGWLGAVGTECNWYGVTCNAGSTVIYLSFNFNQLNGTIPDSLGNLINILEIDLSSNQLSGSIPSSLGNLTHLNGLNLSGNQLSGSIPSSLGARPRIS
jgi:hypothetical protein